MVIWCYLLIVFECLFIFGEYLYCEVYDIGECYGKDIFLLIDCFGMGWVFVVFVLKSCIDGWFESLGLCGVIDCVIQLVMCCLFGYLLVCMGQFCVCYEYYLLFKVLVVDVVVIVIFLCDYFVSGEGDYFQCMVEEGCKVFLYCFVVVGVVVWYCEVYWCDVEDIVVLDVVLCCDDCYWVEQLLLDFDVCLVGKFYYGYFLCYVFYQDYIVCKGEDLLVIEYVMWVLLDQCGVEYLVEYNVGYFYLVKLLLVVFYCMLDFSNVFNFGIGQILCGVYWGGYDCGCY